MEVEINIGKRYLFVLILVVCLLGFSFYVSAVWVPDYSYHNPDEIRVTVDNEHYGLQEALYNELIGADQGFTECAVRQDNNGPVPGYVNTMTAVCNSDEVRVGGGASCPGYILWRDEPYPPNNWIAGCLYPHQPSAYVIVVNNYKNMFFLDG